MKTKTKLKHQIHIISILALLLMITNICTGQNWQKFNEEPNGEVNRLYADTVADMLYMGGGFTQVGNTSYPYYGQYDGFQFSVNPHITSVSVNSFSDLRRINGDLYGYGHQGLFKWNGSTWDTIGIIQSGALIRGIIEYGSGLIVYGGFTNISGVTAHCFAKWDGSSWSALTSKPFQSSSYCHVAKVYNGSVFFSGPFQSLDNSLKNFIQYDGDSLLSVPAFGAAARCMEIYNNELYIGGDFTFLNWYGAHTNHIVKFDGDHFSDVGGSMQASAGDFGIFDFAIYHNELYAVGDFWGAGGVWPLTNVAKWNGVNWCGLGVDFRYVYAVEVYHDSLFIGGYIPGWTTPEGFQHISKWIGGNYVDTCGNATGAAEIGEEASVSIHPNPFTELATITLKGSDNIVFDLSLFDQLGREVRSVKNIGQPSFTIYRENLNSGIYFYRISDSKDKRQLKAGKLIIQ